MSKVADAPELTDAEVDAFIEAHKNDPVDEESDWRIEWLFREKLATDALIAGRQWLDAYQETVDQKSRAGRDMERIYGKALIANLVRVVDTLRLEPTWPRANHAALDALAQALKAAQAHLEYCGYGDSWERECAKAVGLEQKIADALSAYEVAKGE